MKVKYPDVEVEMVGHDGNAFAIIGRTRVALRNHGVPQDDIDNFTDEVSGSMDYDELIQTVMKWVNVS